MQLPDDLPNVRNIYYPQAYVIFLSSRAGMVFHLHHDLRDKTVHISRGAGCNGY